MPKPVAGNRSSLKGAWRPTKIMNARDLSRDDDFLSHLLVEKLGTGTVPLVVHKMDPSRELPKTESSELLQIVRRLVAAKGPAKTAIRHAVDEILSLPAVRYYLLHYNQKQINAFATHASRYFELYLPSGSIEIAHTSRYSHRTGKSELCILSTRPLVPGQVISELKGSMADLTDKEDKDLKRTDERHTDGVGIRRDFSVIHSKQLKKNHLFLGPARFVNHDCDHNVELFREGRYITFRVIKPIAVGEEVTAHYGDGYFGRKNRHCLCETCEKNGRGGYAPTVLDDDVSDSGSGTRSDVESDAGGWDSSSTNDSSDWTTDEEVVNVNERRTRRGVYAVVEDRSSPTSGAGPIELDAEVEPDTTSDLTSLASSSSSVAIPPNEGPSKGNGLMTPDPEPSVMRGWSASVTPSPRKSTPAGVSTRSQMTGASAQDKGKGVAKSRSASSVRQLETPPLTSDNGSAVDSLRSSSRIKGRAPTKETSSSRSTPMKGRGRASARGSTVDAAELKGRSQDDPELETRTLRKRVFLPSAADAPKAAGKKPAEGPRGVDGKPLPTCVTCSNVLPVISLDDQVIWGLSLGRTGKRGRPRKNVNVECPRCMRHFEIYALKWPERVPTRGGTAFVPEPREFKSNTPTEGSSSRKITPHTLHALDRKLSAATVPAKRPYKRLGEGEEVDDDRPAKRKKPSTGRPRGRPPKNRVGMSSRARELLNVRTKGSNERRSSRARVPSLKMRESEPPKGKTKAPASSSSTSSSLTAESEDNDNAAVAEQVLGEVPADPQSPVKTGEIVKVQTPKSLAVAAQPREANGRFGKKASTNGRYMRKNFTFTAGGRRLSRAQRAKYRSKVRAEVEKEREEEKAKAGTERVSQDPPAYALPETESAENMESAAIKRLREEEEEEEEDRTGKKPRVDEEEEEEAEAEAEEEEEDEENDDNDEEGADSLHFRVPLAGGMKSGVGLLSGANPVAFARRKWVCVNSDGPSEAPDTLSAFGMQSSTDDDADLPVTPEDETDHTVAVVDSREELSDAHEEKDEDEDEDEDANHVSHAPSLPFRASYLGRLTFKPSPVNLARRRWAPQPKARTVNDVEHIAESCRKQSYLDPPTPASLDLFEAEPLEVMRRQNRATNTRRSPSDAMEADISSSEEDAQSSNHSLDDSERDSEQAVERIVLAPPSEPPESRPPSAPNRSPPSTQMSPGLAWKQTVLLPSNVPYPDFSMLAVSFPLNAPSSPAKLINAGWDTSSDTDS